MPAEPRMTNDSVNFQCCMERCKKCCCGPFDGIGGNISNVESRPFREIVLTGEDRCAFIENGRADLIEERISALTGKTYHIMRTDDDGRCLAYIDGCCSVNDFKPTVCRAFPFYFDMFTGLCAIRCEGFSDDTSAGLDEYRGSIEAAKKMYEFWIGFYDCLLNNDRSRTEE